MKNWIKGSLFGAGIVIVYWVFFSLLFFLMHYTGYWLAAVAFIFATLYCRARLEEYDADVRLQQTLKGIFPPQNEVSI